MKRRSEPADSSASLRDKIIGLGERSLTKSYYPQLRQQLDQAQESKARLQERSAALLNMLEDLEETRGRLVQSEARYRALVENITDVIFSLDVQGVVTYVSPVIQNLTGLSPDQIIGRPLDEFVYADDRPVLIDFERIPEGQTRQLELRLRGEEEQVRHVRASGRALVEDGQVVGLTGVLSDITDRKRAEQELRQSEEKYRTLLQKIEAAVVVHGADTRILTCNSMAQRLLGLTEAQMLGKATTDPVWHFVHENGIPMTPREYPAARVAETRQALRNYVLGVRRPGKAQEEDTLWVLVNADPVFDAEDDLVQVIVTLTEITEMKRMEQDLSTREREYRTLVESIPDLIVRYDSDLRRTYVNPAWEAASGLSVGQVVGTPMTEALNSEDWYARRIKGVFETGARDDLEFEWTNAFGRTLYLHYALVPERNEYGHVAHVLAVGHDLTEGKRAEAALRASQEKLGLLLEQALLGVIEWDTSTRAREWNPAAEAIFGYSREEAIGRRVTELILPESAWGEVQSVWRGLMDQTGGYFNTNENFTKDGRTIVCEWFNTPLTDDSGTVVGVMALVRDVTERKQAEELRVAKTAAEAASAAKTAFLANMSHEIRTPMNAILGFSQLMRHDKGLTERQQQQLDIINSSGEHLLALINDVLEMSKVEAGRISVNPTTFDLHALIEELGALFGLRTQAKGLELRVDLADDVPRFVVTDENKLRQVLVNLLGNAVKFTDEGRVELRVATRADEADRLHLLAEVSDTGMGIDPQDMERLFHYFEQAASGREAQTGTGLGLAISREFAHVLGGEISVESELGVGSTFTLDVLAEVAQGEQAVAPEDTRIIGLAPGEPRYRVLVADDAPDNRELLVELLEPMGFDVRAVANGAEALEQSEEWHPRLILMDMRMPVMDGYEATRRIRSGPGGADIAIIGVTASAFAEMRQGVFDAGVDEFVVKPFRESELLDKIGKLLDAHYVYEERAEGIELEVADTLDSAAMILLPSDLLFRIGRAARNADFDAVLELADEVGLYDGDTAAALRTVAERFDSERILAALGEGGGS